MDQIAPWISIFFQSGIQMPYELLMKLAALGAILFVTWIVSRILGSVISKVMGKLNTKAARQVRRMITWVVWLVGILISLDQLGLELTITFSIITLGGLILVIALRDMLSNLASHEAITAYNPFKIGDWIQVSKCFGRVVDITWMNTILMTLDNERVYIPNSKITKSTIINRTSSGETRIAVPLTIDDTLDLSEVEKTLLEIGTEIGEELASDSKPEVRVTKLANMSVNVELLLKIHNPAKRGIIASNVLKIAKMKLDELKRRTSNKMPTPKIS